MKKRILFIGYNFHPELTGIGKYSGEMVNWLARNGYDCTVLTTYPYYPYWKVQEPYLNNRFWYKAERECFGPDGKVTIYRCPMYVPAKPSGIKRILLDFSFLISAGFKLLQLLPSKKFSLVCVVAPSFQFGLLGVLYKKFHKTKLLYHIQDLQIEAARDLQLISSKKVINLLFRMEKYIFNKSDIISSISEGMVNKIKKKAAKDVLLFPNWTDTKLFYPIEDRATLKKEFGFNATDKIVLYSGAIGEKQGLEAILQAAIVFKKSSDLKFVICGSGPYKEKLQNLATDSDLHNVVFFPLQPYDRFNQFLNIADVHLVIQKSTAGDLVMPSKLTTILAVGGLALITADEGSGLYSLVQENAIALVVKAENQEALNNGIQKAVLEDNSTVIKNARQYAENHLSIESIMEMFEIAIST
jgi:colanic acid biosynthesis glycosyl transferase WcaI